MQFYNMFGLKYFKMHFVMTLLNLREINSNLNLQFGREVIRKMRVEGNLGYYKMAKYLKKLA